MGDQKIKCYLCGTEATSLTPDDSGDEIIECRRCANRYRISAIVFKYYFKQEDEEILNENDKKKLSEFVYKHVVVLNSDVVKKVTQKESVNER